MGDRNSRSQAMEHWPSIRNISGLCVSKTVPTVGRKHKSLRGGGLVVG